MTESPIRSLTLRNHNNSTASLLQSTSTEPRFVGTLQPVKSRKPVVPEVNYEKGGCDFRTPHNTSSFGKQIVKPNSRRIILGTSTRFKKAETIGIGPNYAGVSSMSRQIISHRKSPGSMVFGTSTRDSSRKLYC